MGDTLKEKKLLLTGQEKWERSPLSSYVPQRVLYQVRGLTGPWHPAPGKRGILEAGFSGRGEQNERGGLGPILLQFGLGAAPSYAGPRY